ncbi:MAG: hypothetical protein J07AB43_05060 [Candidatus Nanosalina sp. J07AB43]|nr:MAG: hypothetical protein J07AB43_05060 [Candidatus Nanosalina sp. J07AB43]
MVNVQTDGELVHEIGTELPGYEASGNTSIGDIQKVVLEAGESAEVTTKVLNVKEISYADPTLSENVSDSVDLELELSPPPGMVQESLPPQYLYDQRTKAVTARISISAPEDAEAGTYNFELLASGDNTEGDITEAMPVEVRAGG